jgi:hypothetical protein
MKSLLILISILPLNAFSASSSFCDSKPKITVDHYNLDYSGGAETTDDASFVGQIECDNKTLSGTFSIGQDSQRLYWLDASTSTWKLVY